jgi:nitrogen fixation NifU-like protein
MDARELYQELILDHGRRPRNFVIPPGANRSAEGKNPLCGDHVIVKLRYENGVVHDVGFQGSGCAISTAAASTMTEVVKGKITGMADAEDESLGKLVAFSGMSEFPMRVKCATLSWHTLEAALDGQDVVSTE